VENLRQVDAEAFRVGTRSRRRDPFGLMQNRYGCRTVGAGTMSADIQTIGLRLRVFIPFACGYFLSYLYRVVNSVIAPNLVVEIGVDPSELGLLTSAYFITFAAAQLPLGVLLDRFGPRRIEAFLLLFAGLGAWVFAEAETLSGLVAGRALIGFGVSACLMAAFKAYVIWYPREQLPSIYGYQMAAGGLGALAATAPVEAALAITDWRGVFVALAVLTLVMAVLVYVVVPERAAAGRELRFGEQVRGVRRVFSSLVFWRIAPWTALSQATFLSIQGLWAGPWLRDVAGYDRNQAAGILMLMAAAMVAGFILMGNAAERLSRYGIRPLAVAATGMLVFMGALLLIILQIDLAAMVLWGLFGFFGTSGILPYAVLSQSFPPQLSGRVNTALNLLVFVTAFLAQWGIGSVIELWPAAEGTGYAPAGYRAAFGAMLAAQGLTFLWYVVGRRYPQRWWQQNKPDGPLQ
jgi:predicted MFS family arabinose efflux permease